MHTSWQEYACHCSKRTSPCPADSSRQPQSCLSSTSLHTRDSGSIPFTLALMESRLVPEEMMGQPTWRNKPSKCLRQIGTCPRNISAGSNGAVKSDMVPTFLPTFPSPLLNLREVECTPAKPIWKLLTFIFMERKGFWNENLNETSNLINHASSGRLLAMNHRLPCLLGNVSWHWTWNLRANLDS